MAALVPALVTLRSQLNLTYPNRSKLSDGWKGDDAHAKRFSYHNPDKNGWVHALDITHDPDDGVDIDRLTDELVDSNDFRILELIANGMYWHFSTKKWVKYLGANDHSRHFHITAKPGVATAMDARSWTLASFKATQLVPAGVTVAVKDTPQQSAEIKNIQRILNLWYPWAKLVEDGIYGPATRNVVIHLQRAAGITADGIVGPQTRKELGIK